LLSNTPDFPPSTPVNHEQPKDQEGQWRKFTALTVESRSHRGATVEHFCPAIDVVVTAMNQTMISFMR